MEFLHTKLAPTAPNKALDCLHSRPLSSLAWHSMVTFLYAILLIAVLLASWLLTLLGMPGNWLMVAATTVYVWLVPCPLARRDRLEDGRGPAHPRRLGRDRGTAGERDGRGQGGWQQARSGHGGMVGSIVGGVLGIFIGLPVPLVGSILAAVLFSALGAMARAVLGKAWSGKNLGTSWRIAKVAFWGRLTGTVGKMLLGS